ncbi:FHA domain-containing protein [Phyllobacterium phragmitis]|uniref:FHA domain-containing protein n=1 Tax=Phyllobacterium phragmitis TaxID=2670329 RepID=A0A2S9IKU2_9HYPH|nr:FHA domain-containing protein [Phyllobacterium phragmitis]PRD41147.1 FHA domain-containing protein [Phyllobacterium phragmitis]
MALRLELKHAKGPLERGISLSWYFERGRRTLGRSAECDWQIPDPQCMISKLHCLIEADRDGFVLHDKSSNGSVVDGVLVLEGCSARLSHGSIIEFGGFAFSVSLTGQKDMEFADPDAGLVLGDENLTVSSILADIAPNSPRSHGLRGHDETLTERVSAKDPARRGSGSMSLSRNVEIGWSGPPETARKAALPEDWNKGSDYGNQLEHAPATRASVTFARNMKTDQAESEIEYEAQPIEPEVLASGDIQPNAPSMADATATTSLLQRLDILAERCEEACCDLFAAFDLDVQAVAPTSDLLELPREEALPARFEAVLSMQLALGTAIGSLLDEMSRVMEPRILEARVDTESRRLPWRSDRAYWQAFKAHFEKDGERLSLRDLFRETMMRSLRGDAEDNTRQELTPGDDIEVSLDK